ncbi:hypothetical protein ACIRU3_38855 [Streptomyces sp. NPDC101151]|uniref:hypothetical protein n=1 Tax=Streptomyces sp. NPDC101151 TaxID=3366115 RepID=UPI00381C9911
MNHFAIFSKAGSRTAAGEPTENEVADTVTSQDHEVTDDEQDEAQDGVQDEAHDGIQDEAQDGIQEEAQAEDGPAGEPDTAPSTGIAAGVAAVVCAGLGVASLTGTWVGTVLSQRQQLDGQIHSSSASPAQQIKQIYGAAWHTVAAVNGAFALAAVLLAALVVIGAKGAAPWVRVVAWGGLALGVLGLLIAGGMWFDLFAGLPQVPAAPVARSAG